jgi:hypothetical protein
MWVGYLTINVHAEEEVISILTLFFRRHRYRAIFSLLT